MPAGARVLGLGLGRPRPLDLLRCRLRAEGVAEQEFAEIEESVAHEVRDAVQFAKQSPMPGPGELFEDLWASPLEAIQ
jgi:acetoin:2,6-dichlorophenolindophenol oxidoreductase subunit alpha